jgi:hypothetical protein
MSQESDTLPSVSLNDEVNDILAASPSKTSNFQGCSAVTFSPKLDFDDADIDDDLDPAMKEELDRLIAMLDCLHSLNEFNLYLVLSSISCGILTPLKQQYILDCKSLLNHMFLRERELSVLAD